MVFSTSISGFSVSLSFVFLRHSLHETPVVSLEAEPRTLKILLQG